MKKILIPILVLSSVLLYAQDEALTITAPSPWATLRSDSIEVSVQADVARLPKKSVDFKVSRNSGGRASVLFSKSVKMEESSADVFLGRSSAVPFGGADYLSLEWSIPGTELKGVVEPIGVVRLAGAADRRPALSAARLKDGATDGQAADVLAGVGGWEVGGVKFAAGWNKDGFYVLLNAPEAVSEVRFAIDGKCGKSAFLSWADRFVVYSADGDSVRGVHYRRSVEKNAIKYDEMAWGDKSALSVSKAEVSRLIKIRWHELGLQPFEERNMGFSAFVKAKSKKASPYPTSANPEIPGTWGDIKLEK